MVKYDSQKLCEKATPDACSACFPHVSAAQFAYRKAFLREHFDHVDAFVAASKFLKERYVDWGLPPERIFLIENGTAVPDSAVPRTLKAGERRSVFGFFGQINPYKGLVQLLSAFETLGGLPRRQVSGLRLNVHGAYLETNHPSFIAQLRGQLTRTARHTRFFGPYRREELPGLMAAVDWVVVPSIWWENAPLVIEEALAHRRPVLCSDIGGMAEKVRDGKDGFHFPVGDPRALAHLLLKVASEPAIWEALQGSMRRPITVEQMVADHLRLYEDCESRRRARRIVPRGRIAKSARRQPEGGAMSGTVKILTLGRGIYAVRIAARGKLKSGATGGPRRLLHACALPGGGRVELASERGQIGEDAWLGPAGGTLIVNSGAAGSRIAIISYQPPGAAGDGVEVAVRQLFSPAETRNRRRGAGLSAVSEV